MGLHGSLMTTYNIKQYNTRNDTHLSFCTWASCCLLCLLWVAVLTFSLLHFLNRWYKGCLHKLSSLIDTDTHLHTPTVHTALLSQSYTILGVWILPTPRAPVWKSWSIFISLEPTHAASLCIEQVLEVIFILKGSLRSSHGLVNKVAVGASIYTTYIKT